MTSTTARRCADWQRAIQYHDAATVAYAYADLLRLYELLDSPHADALDVQAARTYGALLHWADALGDGGARDFLCTTAKVLRRSRRARRAA